MFKYLLLVLLFYSLVAEAKTNADHDTSIVANGNGSYSITRAFSPNGGESPSTLESEAESFCANRNKYFYFTEMKSGALFWTLTFKCITDKNKAELQKRLSTIRSDGTQQRR
ncbi:hypothetical protein [Geomonas anaerohicana]|uniref:Uncharacterized protein n=1 Tax=Geomonas anaerohicana TaxID=2798583 RepID=A0ABS0YH91_9BACT|nr:hypothetical protein [Geomonas anaerohicana]MBJ6751499.1 hypothetical protein [Geomonas anaerohicana]